jgi:hypothetical protein
MNFIFQRATFGCKIVSSLKKAIRICGNQKERKTGSNPARNKIFSSFSNRAEQLWGQTILLFNGYLGSFLG